MSWNIRKINTILIYNTKILSFVQFPIGGSCSRIYWSDTPEMSRCFWLQFVNNDERPMNWIGLKTFISLDALFSGNNWRLTSYHAVKPRFKFGQAGPWSRTLNRLWYCLKKNFGYFCFVDYSNLIATADDSYSNDSLCDVGTMRRVARVLTLNLLAPTTVGALINP